MQKILGLKTFTLTLILCGTLYATNNTEEVQRTKKPPVDEGHNLKPKEDKTKDVTFVNDEVSKKELTLSLEKQKEELIINFKQSSKVPLTCKVMRGQVEILSMTKEPKNPKENTALVFIIVKSKLKINDEIIITNSRGTRIRKIQLLK
jgi:hypothetical protein